MFQLFRVLGARLKALFVANVALDLESDFASRGAERKAELLRQAADYEKEGLPEVANELRQRADEIDMQRPLASVLPSIEHWQAHGDAERPALPHNAAKNRNPLIPNGSHTAANTKKKRR